MKAYFQVEGINGHNGNGNGEAHNGDGNGNLADQVVNSALRYRGQAPLIDTLMAEIGLSGGDVNGLTNVIQGFATKESAKSAKDK